MNFILGSIIFMFGVGAGLVLTCLVAANNLKDDEYQKSTKQK